MSDCSELIELSYQSSCSVVNSPNFQSSLSATMESGTPSTLILVPSPCKSESSIIRLSTTNVSETSYTTVSEEELESEQPFHSTPKKQRTMTALELADPLELKEATSSGSLELKEATSSGSLPKPSKCCNEECLQFFSFAEAKRASKHFKQKGQLGQNQFLLDSSLMLSSAGQHSSSWMIEGKKVCKVAFCKIFNISQKRLHKCKSLQQDGVTTATRKVYKRPSQVKTSEASSWMKYYFKLVGDKMPHIQKIHLPHFLTKKDVYEQMKREFGEQGISSEEIISLSHFYRIWETEFSDVLIPKQNLFSKCDICVKFAMERVKTGGRCGFTEEYSAHIHLVMNERSKYNDHRLKARRLGSKCITIIIDGMDQSKTNLPRMTQLPKSAQGLHQLRTHISGAQAHTIGPDGKIIYAFIDMLQYPHDSNMTIHVLLSVLDDIKKLPPVLNLQLDNTARENKNKYVLGFCALLVSKKIFKKVKINFLPVGHTHEDIDQFFSTISKRLSKKGAETLPDLQYQISKSTDKPSPKAVMIDHIRDVKSWLEPCLEAVHGHSTPHCFKFLIGADNSSQVLMFFRRWSSDPWCDSADAIKILKELPSGIPQLVQPSDQKVDLPKLKEDIPKYRPWLSQAATLWWDQLDVESIYTGREEDNMEWMLLNLQDVEQSCVDGDSETQTPQVPGEQNEDLATLFAAETQPCNVYVGSRRTAVSAVNDLSGLAVGQFIAVYTDEESSEPWIGRIENISKDEVEVVWLEGGYTKKWKIAKVPDPENKRKRIEWRDTISKESIILFDFQLTSTGTLRKPTIEHLKKVYAQRRQVD